MWTLEKSKKMNLLYNWFTIFLNWIKFWPDNDNLVTDSVEHFFLEKMKVSKKYDKKNHFVHFLSYILKILIRKKNNTSNYMTWLQCTFKKWTGQEMHNQFLQEKW